MSTEIIHEKQDLTYLSWSLIRSSSGTAGSFLKATDDLQQPKIYYKLSNYDGINGIVGHECINEIIVDRLLNILEIEHLHYDLIHADIDVDGKEMETYLCASKDFKAHGEHKVALDAYYQAEKLDGETPLQFCTRNGWSDFIYKMLVVDFLILNRDRHARILRCCVMPGRNHFGWHRSLIMDFRCCSTVIQKRRSTSLM